MPVYEIEQYELHTQKYRVEADSEAEAIAKLFNGEADTLDGSLEFIEVSDDFGMSRDDNLDLAKSLWAIDVFCTEVIPSVRSIEIVNEQT